MGQPVKRKRVFIVHGWGGNPRSCWLPNVHKELETRGFLAYTPAFPNTQAPDPAAWLAYLKKMVGKPDKDTYFIGHSLGPTAIMLYLEQLEADEQIGGFLSVAGGFRYKPENMPKDLASDPWYGRMPDFKKIKEHCSNIIALFSDDDPIIVLDDKDIFEKELGAKIVVMRRKKHFINPNLSNDVLTTFDELFKQEAA